MKSCIKSNVLTKCSMSAYTMPTDRTGPCCHAANEDLLTLLQLGWACLLLQPIALAYGRRGVYLLSTLLTVPIMVWTSYSSSTGEWYAHRIIIGIAVSPIESLPEISVADLMFAHERGTW